MASSNPLEEGWDLVSAPSAADMSEEVGPQGGTPCGLCEGIPHPCPRMLAPATMAILLTTKRLVGNCNICFHWGLYGKSSAGNPQLPSSCSPLCAEKVIK